MHTGRRGFPVSNARWRFLGMTLAVKVPNVLMMKCLIVLGPYTTGIAIALNPQPLIQAINSTWRIMGLSK